MKEFEERTKEYKQQIETYLGLNIALHDTEPQKVLFDSMRYSLLAGGKRLRPIFVYDFCRMCGSDWKKASPFAAASEMIHTYSLIHDDLPCMDNDDFRRGNPTNHKVYGEGIAVLAGDALLTGAFDQLYTAPYDAESRIKAVHILSECSGEIGMVGGQVLDIMSEERACTAQEVIDIQVRKTGALIRSACMLGVIAGGGSEKQLEAAADFAFHLGLAFQIRDDMLDVIGTAEEMGKAVGTDATKNTFVRLYGLEKCEELVAEHTKQAIGALNAFEDHEYMIALAQSLTTRTV